MNVINKWTDEKIYVWKAEWKERRVIQWIRHVTHWWAASSWTDEWTDKWVSRRLNERVNKLWREGGAEWRDEEQMSVFCHHLSDVNPKIVLVVRPVADCQTQLLLLAGFVQLHLLEEQRKGEWLVVWAGLWRTVLVCPVLSVSWHQRPSRQRPH